MRVISEGAISKYLMDEGLVPQNCTNVNLEIPVGGIVMVHYTVMVTGEDLKKLNKAISMFLEDRRPPGAG